MRFVSDPLYWFPTLVGFGGVLLWILSTWADPTDDTIHGTLSRALGRHSRTVVVSLLSYLLASMIFFEMNQWTILAAISTGYMAQSLLTKVMDTTAAKLAARAGDGK